MQMKLVIDVDVDWVISDLKELNQGCNLVGVAATPFPRAGTTVDFSWQVEAAVDQLISKLLISLLSWYGLLLIIVHQDLCQVYLY